MPNRRRRGTRCQSFDDAVATAALKVATGAAAPNPCIVFAGGERGRGCPRSRIRHVPRHRADLHSEYARVGGGIERAFAYAYRGRGAPPPARSSTRKPSSCSSRARRRADRLRPVFESIRRRDAVQAAVVPPRGCGRVDARRACWFFFLRRRSLGFSYVAARFIWSRNRSVSQAFLNRFINTTASSPGLALTLGMAPQ